MSFNHSLLNSFYEPTNSSTVISYYNKPVLDTQVSKTQRGKRIAVAVVSALSLGFWKPDKVADEFRKLLADSEEAKTAKNRLDRQRRLARESGRFLTSAQQVYDQHAKLDGEFVFAECGLCHRSALTAVKVLGNQVKKGTADEEWVLSDYPPEGMNRERNPFFTEKVAYLGIPVEIQKQLTELPFVRELGWFPHCQFAGILDGSRVGKNHFPTLRFVAGWVRRPQLFGEAFDNLLDVVRRNSKAGDPLADFQNDIAARIALYYFVPTFYFSNAIDYSEMDRELLTTLRGLATAFPGEMGPSLAALYRDKIPT